MLAAREGRPFDEGGEMAAGGQVDEALLGRLNALDYYGRGYPKSLDNDFGTHTVYPMIVETPGNQGVKGAGIGAADALRTYVEHIAIQVREAVVLADGGVAGVRGRKMLVTGGGAHNRFLTGRIRELLEPLEVEVVIPEDRLVDFKEALVMALLGVLRWREENTVLGSVTGARRDSIGGAVWMGQEV
jgi:anhydro-N-acetylmuramic acid kinase